MSSRIHSALERVPPWGLTLAVVLAPLPFASNRPWSWNLLGVWIGLLLLCAAVGTLVRASAPVWRSGTLLVPGILFAAVACFVAVQASCWTPAGWHHPAWQYAASLSSDLGCPAISIDPQSTWSGLSRLLTYGGAFWLATQIGGSTRDARRIVKFAALSIAVYAAYGLLMKLSGADLILWYRKWAYEDDVTGTFVNRNSFACFAGMGAVCNLAILAHGYLEDHEASGGRGGWARKCLEQLARNHVHLIGFVLCATAVVLTSSRAGLASTIVGLVALMVTVGIHHRTTWRSRTASSAFVAGAVILAVAAGGGQLLKRMESVSDDAEQRGIVISRTVEAALQHPWAGVGYGTFEDAWPFYRPPGVNLWFRQAHSSYAESMLELGIPATIALISAVGWLLGICAGGLVRRRRNGMLPSVAIAACSVPIVHSAIDFSLQIPAIVLLFAVLLGIGVRQSFPTRKIGEDTGDIEPVAGRDGRLQKRYVKRRRTSRRSTA